MIQNVADGMKFMTKEHMVPEKADRFIYELAPVIIISTTVLVFAFIPLGPTLYAANSELSLLFMMAIFGIAPLGVFFAGWSSNNKYTLIGGMRSAAQLTAYEIPLLITVLAVAVLSGSFNLIEIVEFQAASSNGAVWNLFLLPLGAVLFLVTMIAEVERIPFDMPEAEAELVEGWWTEYGGMRWGLMFASEYLRAYAACLLFALMFLGGWEAPFEDILIGLPMIGGLFGTIFYLIPHTGWLLIKSWLLFAGFVWVRSALHRVRTDQILEFGWRYLLPLSLLNLALAFWLRLAVFDNGPWPLMVPLFITTIAVVLFVILVMDEDEEALEAQRRPYSVQSTSVAAPGAGKE
jgi:NADH:ubiquinone oxidoreductase subunit H